VSRDVELQMVSYKREVQDAEQVLLQERQKWLTNRIVVIQSNGTLSAADRSLLCRLRAELQACDAKIDAYKQDLALIPACPEPVNAGTPPDRRRPSDELATATTAPLAPLAPRGHRNGRASPDFGARGEPPAPKSVPPWGAGALGQSTRVKGDLFGRYEMQAEALGSPPVKVSPGKRSKLPPVPLTAR
ncbi:unnamed protein product, partial [Durusdinium trenchii]